MTYSKKSTKDSGTNNFKTMDASLVTCEAFILKILVRMSL